ncbi:hypothetical protein [Mycobacterium sp. URHB0021]
MLASLSDGLAGAGAPWGDDHLGKQFADGAAGYIAQVDYVHTSIDAKSGLLDGYSDGMRTAANTLEQQDTGGGSNGPGTNSDLVDPSTSDRPPAKRRSGTKQAVKATPSGAPPDAPRAKHAALQPEIRATPAIKANPVGVPARSCGHQTDPLDPMTTSTPLEPPTSSTPTPDGTEPPATRSVSPGPAEPTPSDSSGTLTPQFSDPGISRTPSVAALHALGPIDLTPPGGQLGVSTPTGAGMQTPTTPSVSPGLAQPKQASTPGDSIGSIVELAQPLISAGSGLAGIIPDLLQLGQHDQQQPAADGRATAGRFPGRNPDAPPSR